MAIQSLTIDYELYGGRGGACSIGGSARVGSSISGLHIGRE